MSTQWRHHRSPSRRRAFPSRRGRAETEASTDREHSVARRLVQVALCAVGGVLLLVARGARADVLDDLRSQLFERRQTLQEIEMRIDTYRQEVTERREQATTLRSQVRVIEQSIAALKLELDKTAVEVEEVQAESAAIAEEIRRVEEDLRNKREQLREMMRLLQLLESDSTVEAFFKYPTLTGALVEVRALGLTQQRTQETIAVIKKLRGDLTRRAAALQDLERELAELQERQEAQQRTLEDQEAAKERLYEITKSQEAEFQGLLEAAAAAQRRANAEIARVEADVRAELERRGLVKLGGVGIFDWPLDPIFGVSCGFHCPDYPYRHLLGPHTGVDLPTHVGTPVRAGADGYVARANDAGGPGYSYVLILHGDDLSTVYGHLSSVAVESGVFVGRGQVIGSSGGTPGTRGAGLSTGPHLHFEVRKNGLSVDPAGFLP